MRKAAIAALIAVLMTVLSPVYFNFAPAANGVSLISLDVCNANSHLSPVGAESPCICQYPVALHIPQTESSISDPARLLSPVLAAVEKDRPPIA